MTNTHIQILDMEEEEENLRKDGETPTELRLLVSCRGKFARGYSSTRESTARGNPTSRADNLSWETVYDKFMKGQWHTAPPSVIREMAVRTALQFTKDHLDTYKNRDPENLSPSNNYLQLMWIASGSHIDVSITQIPSRSKEIPAMLSFALTRLYYYARKKKGPHIRKTVKNMSLGIHSKKWMQQQRNLVLLDTDKYAPIQDATSYQHDNASKVYMMMKIHKQKTTLGRILVQGFSYLEATANFVSYYGYYILKGLSHPIKFLKVRAEHEYVGLDAALAYIFEINCIDKKGPTLTELDVEGRYPSIKHNTVHKAFKEFFEFVPELTIYINVWARSLYLLDHALVQVDGTVYQQKSGLSQGSAACSSTLSS